MTQIVLLSDERRLDELLRFGDLPGPAVNRVVLEADHAWRDRSDAPIEWMDPSWLTSTTVGNNLGGDGSPGSHLTHVATESRQQCFARMLGKVICHLVVLENQQAVQGERSHMDRVTLQEGSDIPAVRAWYEQFGKEAKRWVQDRDEHYRHVLILVCCDYPKNPEHDAIQWFVDHGTQPFCPDVGYLMMPYFGIADRTALHARYCWPIAVSRLLEVILARGEDEIPVIGSPISGGFFAWGNRIIESADQRDLVEDVRVTAFNTAYETLRGGEASALLEPESCLLQKSKIGMESPVPKGLDMIPVPKWIDYCPQQRWETLSTDAESDEVLDRVQRCWNDSKVDVRRYREDCRALWTKMRRSPQGLGKVLAELDSGLDPRSLREQIESLSEDAEKLFGMVLAREALAQQYQDMVWAVEGRQAGFVPLRYRFVFSMIASLLVGYVSVTMLYFVSDAWWIWSLIAMASSFGASCALAWWSWWRENVTGKSVVENFEQQITIAFGNWQNDFRSKMVDSLNGKLCAADDRVRFSFRERLQMLLTRVDSVFSMTLQQRPKGVGFHEGFTSVSDESVGEDQRRRYRKLSGVLTTSAIRLDQVRDKVVIRTREETKEFLEEKWKDFCDDYDQARAGYLPVSHLVPLMDSFASHIRDRAEECTFSHLVASLEDDWCRQIDAEFKKVRETRDLNYLLSCDAQPDKHFPTGFVGGDSAYDFMQFTELVHPAVRSKIADGQNIKPLSIGERATVPHLAMLHSRCRINLAEGPEGILVLKEISGHAEA